MKFSIIIPTLNECENIDGCIRSVIENSKLEDIGKDTEIIIVDGGSKDDTLLRAGRFSNEIEIKMIQAGRASMPDQLNKGASIASGDIMVFLHADCKFPINGFKKIECIFKKIPDLAGGAFTMKVEGRRFFYRILSIGGNIYCRVSKILFGDRAVFVRKKIFNRLAGFKVLPIMSDIDFSRRIKKAGKVCILKGPVVSSGRKFENEPFYKIIHSVLWALAAFNLGSDPSVIKRRYYGS